MRTPTLLLACLLLHTINLPTAADPPQLRRDIQLPSDLGLNFQGLSVTDVAKGSLAESMRIAPGALLVSCEGKPVNSWEEVLRILQENPYSSRFRATFRIRGRKGPLRFDLLSGRKRFPFARIAGEVEVPIDLGLLLKGNSLEISRVLSRSPASTGSMRTGDQIVECVGKTVESWDDLVDILQENRQVPKLSLAVLRRTKRKELELDLLKYQQARFANNFSDLRLPVDAGFLIAPDNLTVSRLLGKSPARKKLKVGDRIVEAQGRKVETWKALREVLEREPAENHLALAVDRDGDRVEVAIRLNTREVPQSNGSGGQTGEMEISVDRRARKYIVEVPSGLKGPLPVVVLLHGTNSSPEYILSYWRRVAGREAILVAPWGDRNWYEHDPDIDRPFLMKMVEEVKSHFDVDLSRIYISGHSRGAYYTHAVALQHGDTFAAAGLFAGGRRPAPSQSRRKAAFIVYHGELDRLVKVSAGRNAYRKLEQAGHVVEFQVEPGGSSGSEYHNLSLLGVQRIWDFFRAHPMETARK